MHHCDGNLGNCKHFVLHFASSLSHPGTHTHAIPLNYMVMMGLLWTPFRARGHIAVVLLGFWGRLFCGKDFDPAVTTTRAPPRELATNHPSGNQIG